MRSGSPGSANPCTNPRTVCRSAGESLQAQPAPCEYSVRRSKHRTLHRAGSAPRCAVDGRELDDRPGVRRMELHLTAEVEAAAPVPDEEVARLRRAQGQMLENVRLA